MGKELIRPSEFLKNISPHDKEVILLATAFFWGKFNRQAIHDETFKPSLPGIVTDDPHLIGLLGFSAAQQANADIEGDAPGKISEAIINNPSRNKLFNHLKNEEIEQICHRLEIAFELDELAAKSECRSLYTDVSPELFAIARASEILWERNRSLNIRWFNIPDGSVRKAIVEAVIKECFPHQLLSNHTPGV
ncbi:MAG: hypothetical protein NTZ93_03400 [Candidatus Beckwithbacteria bacterium]|nr:hypothetical protein [Candidatus Beckwithbacteria bacterium]